MKVGCVKEVCLLRLSGNNCRVRSGQSGLARLQSAVAVQPRWPGCFQIRIATKLSLSLDQIEPDLMPKKMAIFGDPKFKVETTKSIYQLSWFPLLVSLDHYQSHQVHQFHQNPHIHTSYQKYKNLFADNMGDQQVKTSLLPLTEDHRKEPDDRKTHRKTSFKVSKGFL